MNFIDLIILVVVLGTLGAIAYFNFIKKDRDACRSCPYKKDNCDCGKKEQKRKYKINQYKYNNISRWNLTFLLTKSVLKCYTIYNRSYLG